MNINPMMLQKFMQFKQNYNGDPRSQIQQMLQSGQISQQQYNNAVQVAQQIQQMLMPNGRR